MKRFKRVTAFFLAAVIILAMGSTVLADEKKFPDPPTETKADISGHEFKAYQIFKGKEVVDGALTGINWGDNINGQTFLEELKNSKAFDENGKNPFSDITYDSKAAYKSADAVARIMEKWASDNLTDPNKDMAAQDGRARAFARLADACKTGEGKGSGQLADGYYLIVDTTADISGNQARNISFLQITSKGVFDPVNKTDIPKLSKKVKEINDSNGTPEWKDAADYDIGDEVEFVLTGTLPSDYAEYEEYRYVFHDTMSPGLVLNENSIEVYLNETKIETGFVTETKKIGTETLRVTFADLKANESVKADTVIRVRYTAKLSDKNVVIGGTGNENKVYLEYSNDPNKDGKGSVGKTPEEKVVVFTYQLIVNKTQKDGENATKPLSGAGFSLYKYDKETKTYKAYLTEDGTDYEVKKGENDALIGYEVTDGIKFTFKGIDAGKYKLVETTVPSGFNRIDDLYFEVKAVFDEETGQRLDKLTIDTVYYNENPKGESLKPIVQDDGTTPVFTFNGVVADGSLSTDILNVKGLLFPATGGIGTTVFYVVGGILIIGAAVLLIVKKRADKSE